MQSGSPTEWIKLLVRAVVSEPNRSAYLTLIEELSPDHGDMLGLARAPAAKRNHHNQEGGLLRHYAEMWEWWTVLRNKLPRDETLSDERVLCAIINHDIHKAYKTFRLVNLSPWETEYSNDTSERLMTWEAKSIWLLMKYGVQMDELQMNAFLWSEGGWSKTQPSWSSVLARVAYLLDELSGNVQERLRKGTVLDVRQEL